MFLKQKKRPAPSGSSEEDLKTKAVERPQVDGAVDAIDKALAASAEKEAQKKAKAEAERQRQAQRRPRSGCCY